MMRNVAFHFVRFHPSGLAASSIWKQHFPISFEITNETKHKTLFLITFSKDFSLFLLLMLILLLAAAPTTVNVQQRNAFWIHFQGALENYLPSLFPHVAAAVHSLRVGENGRRSYQRSLISVNVAKRSSFYCNLFSVLLYALCARAMLIFSHTCFTPSVKFSFVAAEDFSLELVVNSQRIRK